MEKAIEPRIKTEAGMVKFYHGSGHPRTDIERLYILEMAIMGMMMIDPKGGKIAVYMIIGSHEFSCTSNWHLFQAISDAIKSEENHDKIAVVVRNDLEEYCYEYTEHANGIYKARSASAKVAMALEAGPHGSIEKYANMLLELGRTGNFAKGQTYTPFEMNIYEPEQLAEPRCDECMKLCIAQAHNEMTTSNQKR